MAAVKWVEAKTLCGEGWHDWPTLPCQPAAVEITAEDDGLWFEDAPTTDYVPLTEEEAEPTIVDAQPL